MVHARTMLKTVINVVALENQLPRSFAWSSFSCKVRSFGKPDTYDYIFWCWSNQTVGPSHKCVSRCMAEQGLGKYIHCTIGVHTFVIVEFRQVLDG